MGLLWSDPELLLSPEERKVRIDLTGMAVSLRELADECARLDNAGNERWSLEQYYRVRVKLERLQDLVGIQTSGLPHDPETWFERNQWTKYFTALAYHAQRGEVKEARRLRQPEPQW